MSDDDTRTKILRAAGEAFADKGFEATTVREICGKAGVNLAAVNYHFGDKERLYSETIRYAHQFRSKQAPLPEWPDQTPPETKLYDFILITMRRMLGADEIPWQAQLMMREMLKPSGACRELVEDYVRPHFGQLLAIFDELLPEATAPYQRMQLGFSVIGQCMFYRISIPVIEMLAPEDERESHYRTEQLAEHIANVILSAVGRERLFKGRRLRNQSSFLYVENESK